MQARGFVDHRLALALIAMALAGCASTPGPESAGTTSRTISQKEVDGLLAGSGMGMAAPAEINGYPGPVHVLELKEELALTPDQRFATSRLVGLVQGQARALGQRIVNAERQLDADMAEGRLTSAQVRGRLDTIASLRAQLRFTHIDAHLQQKKILTAEQVQRYYEIRGREVVVPAPAALATPTEPLVLPGTTPTAPAEPAAQPVASPVPVLTPVPVPVPSLEAAPDVKPAEEPVPEAPANEVPAYPLTPMEETSAPTPPALVPEIAPPADPAREAPAVEEAKPLSPGMQDAMEEAEPANLPPAYPLTPMEETSAPTPPALVPEIAPAADPAREAPAAEEAKPLSPGVQDAMEEAEPANVPPAYPLTPMEETSAPTPPALVPEIAPAADPAREAPAVEEAKPLSPGVQDAMEEAEPANVPPAYPLTPMEETSAPTPPALVPDPVPTVTPAARAAPATPDAEPAAKRRQPVSVRILPPAREPAPAETEPATATPSIPAAPLSPGMQDAIEFAEPQPAEPPQESPGEAVHIAPLEDEIEELEPLDPAEPVTIDLDN